MLAAHCDTQMLTMLGSATFHTTGLLASGALRSRFEGAEYSGTGCGSADVNLYRVDPRCHDTSESRTAIRLNRPECV